jgi:hypothetical protein
LISRQTAVPDPTNLAIDRNAYTSNKAYKHNSEPSVYHITDPNLFIPSRTLISIPKLPVPVLNPGSNPSQPT